MANSKLEMSFDPNTITHLGVKMYSNLPNALAELIANAYDADAENVSVVVLDDSNQKSVQVIDDGFGMNFKEINDNFLRIGKNRRQYNDKTTPKGRKVTGRKGLGKLALFGIGEKIEIVTTKKGDKQKISFTLDWNEISSGKLKRSYKPKYKFLPKANKAEQGTSITLSNLKRKTKFQPAEDIAESISKLFGFFDRTFKVSVSVNDDLVHVNQKLRYNTIDPQFTWTFKELSKNIASDYEKSNKISGEIFSTEKPIKPALRGITLFARGRMVNAGEFFGAAESSFGYSYFTGWLNIDFIDDGDEDFISTDRQSLNWELPETIKLREFLKNLMNELNKSWRQRRDKTRKDNISKTTSIDIPTWLSTLPIKVKAQIEKIIESVSTSETEQSEVSTIINAVHIIAPEYADFHWRHLHSDIHDVAIDHYKSKHYYAAFAEAVKKYLNCVKEKSGYAGKPDQGAIDFAFGNQAYLRVAQKYKDYKLPNSKTFNDDTINNIENGQKYLSTGIVAGCRNPVQHENAIYLNQSGLFIEKDCLDALSILSHLFRRLEDAEIKK